MLTSEHLDGIHCFAVGDAFMYRVESFGSFHQAQRVRNSGLKSLGGKFKAITIRNDIFKVYYDKLAVVKISNASQLTEDSKVDAEKLGESSQVAVRHNFALTEYFDKLFISGGF